MYTITNTCESVFGVMGMLLNPTQSFRVTEDEYKQLQKTLFRDLIDENLVTVKRDVKPEAEVKKVVKVKPKKTEPKATKVTKKTTK